MVVLSFANPPGIPAPAARYSHTALVEGAARWLHLSGQVPVAADGSVPGAAEAQAALVAQHLATALAHHGMRPENVVKLTTYITDRAMRPAWQPARDALFAGHRPPASTQLIVAGLADPRWMIEVELVAAA
jgi:enamine deaminase RidA (YjgF/YER057c/UK114 family)